MRLSITDKKLDNNRKPTHSQLVSYTTYKSSMDLENYKQIGNSLLNELDHKSGINFREMKITDDTGKELYTKGIDII